MAEPSTLLAKWNRTVETGPHERAITDAATGQSWTRSQLDAAASEWHSKYGEIVAGQRIALAEPNGADWLRVFLGSLSAAAVVVPLDPGEPVDAQRDTARAIGATVLCRNGEVEALTTRRRRAREGGRLIKLTSGSTGAPRPILFQDAEMIAYGRQLCAAMGIRDVDINLGLIPWGHSYGLGNLVMPLILQGTAIVFGSAPLPHAIASAVETWQPTIFPAVPALLRALAESSVPTAQLQSLQTVISAGAPLPPEVAQRFQERFGRKIHNFYGSTETGGISYDPSGDSAALGRGVGQPIPGVELVFGRGGRFEVRSAAVYTIGNRRPGSHRMADIGQLDVRGELKLAGRVGRFVKIAGRRLNLAEVEQALKRLPGVRDAMVTPHAARADALAAAVATERSANEIRDALRQSLASWKIPKKIVILGSFPLTSRGKTDTRQLQAVLAE
jgi:long-chain acyl-CoA synthetase